MHECKCVCECIVYVPVCLSSPHEKFQPSKLTSFEVTDIWALWVCVSAWVCVCALRECKCVCECTVCVPVCLSSPHEKFQPSKLTGFEVTDIELCECVWVRECVCVHCVSANVCVSALYVCLYASVVHMKNFSHLSWPVLKLQTFELCECVWVRECVCALREC